MKRLKKPARAEVKTVLDALLPRLRQRLLATFFLTPERAWSSSELARHLQVTPSSLSRELANFEDFGILVSEKIGRMKRYRPNPETQVFAELQGLVEKTVGLVGILKELIHRYEKEIEVAFIYGSIGRNEASTSSDVDLMIIGKLELSRIAKDLRQIESKILRPINPTIYNKEEWKKAVGAKNNFIETVRSGKKIFLKGNSDDVE